MRTRLGLAALSELPHGAAVSIGNYDGVHLGHQAIVRTLRGRGAPVALVTFEPHPLTVLKPAAAPPRLTPARIKNELLADAGVDELVVLPPTPDVLNLTAEDFWARLRDDVRTSLIVEGRSFNFGKGRGGTVPRLQQWSREAGIEMIVLDDVTAELCDQTVVSVGSTLVRWLVAHGRMQDVARCLGRAYAAEGTVVTGFQRGRTIGVPTANLRVEDQLIPGDGVYAGRARVGDRCFSAAISIGNLPTFDNGTHQIEAHLLDFDGDLYGQPLRLEIAAWVRDQVRFASIDALKRQIARDIDRIRQCMNSTTNSLTRSPAPAGCC